MINTPKALLLALAVIMFGIAETKDSRAWTVIAPISCEFYLDAYSKTTMKGVGNVVAPHEMWKAMGFINGIISGINLAKGLDLGRDIPNNQKYKWIASWCRDNVRKELHDAVLEFLGSVSK